MAQRLEEQIALARSVRGIPFDQLEVGYSSIGELFVDRCRTHPQKTWMIYYDAVGNRTELTYELFFGYVQKTARLLLNHGVTKGSRIATAGHNHYETVVQYFAAWMIGATVVPLNMEEDADRLTYILDNSRTELIFVRAEYFSKILELTAPIERTFSFIQCGLVGENHVDGGYFHEELSSLLSNGSDPVPILPRLHLLDSECLIVYTSGTTGAPKGVVLTHGNLMADALGISQWHEIKEDTRMMCVLPIHHVNGTVVTIMTPMFAGSSLVLNRKFQSDRFFERIAEENVAIVSVVPTLLAFLCGADVQTGGLDLSRFRHIICGAGPLTCELAERFESRYHIPIIHGYGLSETTCYSCFLPVGLSDDKRHSWLVEHGFPSIGPAIPQNEMAIHDEHGNEVADGERGEIVIRGHNVMSGYYNNPEANEKAFNDGWFHSGDEGFALADDTGQRFFFITGRLKELIIRGGVNLSPLEIDEVLNSHPKVDAGIAVAFENSWYGEEVGAYVRPSDSTLTVDEILAYCSEHLPWHKQPKVVLFGDDIPVTSTGKYQRNRLRELFSEHKETQFRRPEKESNS